MGTTSLMMYGTTCGWPDFILKHMKVSKYEFSLFLPFCCACHKISVLVSLGRAGASTSRKRPVSPATDQHDSCSDSGEHQSDPGQCVCV